MRREMRMAGVGGQGVITMSYIFGRAASIYDKKKVIMTEAYGPEITGGFSRADLIIADEEIEFPLLQKPDYMVVLSNDEWHKNKHLMSKETSVLYDSKLVTEGVGIPVPAFETALEMKKKVVANIVMMGVLQEISQDVSKESLERALLDRVPKGTEELNLTALKRGYEIGRKYKEENL